jgi:hypothetical protein
MGSGNSEEVNQEENEFEVDGCKKEKKDSGLSGNEKKNHDWKLLSRNSEEEDKEVRRKKAKDLVGGVEREMS